MNCKELEKYYQDYLDNELPLSLRQVVEDHISTCVACHDKIDAYRQVITLVQLRSVAEPPQAYWEQTWGELQSRLTASISALRAPAAQMLDRERASQSASGRMGSFLWFAAAVFALFVLTGVWSRVATSTKPTTFYRVIEYTLTYDQNAEDYVKLQKTLPIESLPDAEFTAYTRAAVGGIDPVSKGVVFMQAEAIIK